MANPLVNDDDSKRIADAAIQGIREVVDALKVSIESIASGARFQMAEAAKGWIRKHGRG